MKSGSSNNNAPPAARVDTSASSHDILADLCAHGDEFIAAAGGHGGRGNRTFASGGNRSPRKVEPGTAGGLAKCVSNEDIQLSLVFHALCMYELELRLIADVGLVRLDCRPCALQPTADAWRVTRCNRSGGPTLARALFWQPSAMPSRTLLLSPSRR